MRAAELFKLAVEDERSFQGIPVTIEWPKGSTRKGVGPDGKPWAREMFADYGYIPDTESKGDGEDVDVYIGPQAGAPDAYVIDQLKEDHSFDEAKIMLGFPDKKSATKCYLLHYPEGWESRIGDIWQVTVSRLAEMVDAEQTVHEQRIMEEADREAGHRVASSSILVVTDPTSGKSISFRDFIKGGGFANAPEVTGKRHFLTVAEVREAGRKYMAEHGIAE